jgi:membrane associated rhomboid family serine protease
MIPYKDDNPSRTFPFITILLILINTAVWVYYRMQGDLVYERAIFEFGMIPYGVLNHVQLPFKNFAGQYLHYYGKLPAYPAAVPPYLTIFTSMFMHGGLAHLAGNMLYLWIFGNNVEDYLGHIRYIFFYLLCGVAAAGTHLFFNAGSQIPTVGASGAISGILAAYLLLYPSARVHVLVPIFIFFTTFTVPAALVIVVWFLFQVLATMGSTAAGGAGVAYWAHVGGFALGLVWIFFRCLRYPPRRPYFRTKY